MKVKSRIARFGGLAIGLSMVLSFAPQAGAVTVAELQAQIAALMAQLQSMSGGSASSAITSDLTVGSSGSQVVALQNTLIAQGYLRLPAGVAAGYFGSLTRAAVKAWQTAVGLPSTGFFGPLSRARLVPSNAGDTTTGGTVGSGSGSGSVAACAVPGVEGNLSVTSAPVSTSSLNVNDQNASILAFNAKATGSDVTLQRIKLDVSGSVATPSTNLTNKVLSKIMLVDDAGNVLASSDVNSNTVVKDSDNRYYITLSGFSSVVPKSSQRTYTVKANLRSSIDSTYANNTSYNIRLAASGVRGSDCAALDVYSPTNATDITRNFTVSANLADSASLTVSTNSATPLSTEIVASAGVNNNEADKVALLVFDIKADKDDVKLTDLIASVAATGVSGATASTTYLYAGSSVSGSPIASASLSASAATFSNMSVLIPKGTTKTFTLAADVRSANATQITFAATVTGNTTNVVGTNSNGDTVTAVSGSATGNSILVRNIGPVFALIGSPTIVKGSTPVIANNATSTATATFNLSITAKGADVMFGSLASGTPMVSNVTVAGNRSFVIYLNGASNNPAVSSTTDFSVPSSGVTTAGLTNSFTLAKDQSVTIPVSFTFQGSLAAGGGVTYGNYAVALERINWVSTNGLTASTFMAGRTEWRTPSVTLP